MWAWPHGEASFGGPSVNGIGGEESRGALFCCGRARQPRRERSSGRLCFLAKSVPSPKSGTRHDARVRPGMSKECGLMLPMWRDAVRSLSVDATAHEPVLGALSVNATVCKPIEMIAA